MPGAGAISDYFYQYGPNYGDGKCTDGTTWANGQCGTSAGQVGYFGYKVLAVSYNGTLKLFGYKGTPLKRAKVTRPFSPFFPSQGSQGSSFFGQLSPNQAPDSQESDAEPAAAAATTTVDPAAIDADPRNSGFSWMRLAANLPEDGSGDQGQSQRADLVPGAGRPLVVGQ